MLLIAAMFYNRTHTETQVSVELRMKTRRCSVENIQYILYVKRKNGRIQGAQKQ